MTLLNYANQAFRTSQKKNSRTGLSTGGFDQVISVGPHDIAPDFHRAHQAILQAPKGNGFWLWKPYFIHRTLLDLPENDWLFYCDSGSYFIDSVQPLVALATAANQQVMTFEDAHPEIKYAKRETLTRLKADTPAYLNTPQRLGGFSLWKNSPQARDFSAEWLARCTDPTLLTDTKSDRSLPEHAAFSAHRHDQAIFSLLAKKKQIPGYRDPSQWGNNRMNDYDNSPYPQLIELTRERDVPLATKLKRRLKKIVGKGKR